MHHITGYLFKITIFDKPVEYAAADADHSGHAGRRLPVPLPQQPTHHILVRVGISRLEKGTIRAEQVHIVQYLHDGDTGAVYLVPYGDRPSHEVVAGDDIGLFGSQHFAHIAYHRPVIAVAQVPAEPAPFVRAFVSERPVTVP